MKKILLLVSVLFCNLSFAGAYVINVTSGQMTIDVEAAISDAVQAGETDITLMFATGDVFFGGTDVISVASGVTNMTLKAEENSITTVNLKSLTLNSKYTALTLENIILKTTSTSTNLIGQSATNYPQSLVFKNCLLEGYRGLFSAAAGEKISVLFDNCVLRKFGSYGVINGGSMLKDVTFRNCTFINVATVFSNSSWVIDTDNPFVLTNCTFYNETSVPMTQFGRFSRVDEGAATLDKIIIASESNNANNLFYSSSGYKNLNFATCFKTSNISYDKFANIQLFDGVAASLFTDPNNGDFSLKSGVAGDILNAGDPTRDRIPKVSAVSKNSVAVPYVIYPDRIEVSGKNVYTQIFASNGQLLVDSKENTVVTSSLSKGIYMVVVSADGNMASQKIVR